MAQIANCYTELVELEQMAMLSPFSQKTTRRIQERKWIFFFANPNDIKHLLTVLFRLINVLKAANQDVPDSLFKFGTTVKKKQHDAYGAFFKDVDVTKSATKITFDD